MFRRICWTVLLAVAFSGRGIAFTSAVTGGSLSAPSSSSSSTGPAPFVSSSAVNRRQVLHHHPFVVVPRGGSTYAAATAAASSYGSTAGSNSSIFNAGEVVVGDPSESRGPLRVLFLSSDTGGGHRASAESLAKQFQIHYPGSTYDLVDLWTLDGVVPYRLLVGSYKYLSAHPTQWRYVYHLSNTRPWELAMDWHSMVSCERRIRRRIASYDPDVIVSVHPTMNNVPLIATHKIARKVGKHIPFFTVVTDLGSGHATWFHSKVDRLYVASERLFRLAKRRGRTPDDRLIMSGLPIRHEFDVMSKKLGDRMSAEGKAVQVQLKQKLGLDSEHPMVLVMGGGEGVGSLSDIVDEVYRTFVQHGVNATVCVVCGRNEKLQKKLEERNWSAVIAPGKPKIKRGRRLARLFRRHASREIETALARSEEHENDPYPVGNVRVVGLGFITEMADYMAAADILVSKAGPGTIAEAAAVGLPIMLTSFLPGQEAGNVDFVLEKGFGDYCDDPVEIAKEVTCWIQDADLLASMSRKASEAGHPHAAADIVLDIGSITHTWLALNGPDARKTSSLYTK